MRFFNWGVPQLKMSGDNTDNKTLISNHVLPRLGGYFKVHPTVSLTFTLKENVLIIKKDGWAIDVSILEGTAPPNIKILDECLMEGGYTTSNTDDVLTVSGTDISPTSNIKMCIEYRYKFHNFVDSPDKTLRKALDDYENITPSDFDNCKFLYKIRFDGDKRIETHSLIMILAYYGLTHPLRVMLENDKIRELINTCEMSRFKAEVLEYLSMRCDTPDHISCVKVLLNHGFDIDSSIEKGYTALIRAVRNYDNTKPIKVELVKLLLQNNARINIKNIKGKSAMDYARKLDNDDNDECTELLSNELERRKSLL